MYSALQETFEFLCYLRPPSQGGTLSQGVKGLDEDVGEGGQRGVVQQGVWGGGEEGGGGRGGGSRQTSQGGGQGKMLHCFMKSVKISVEPP